MKRPGLWFWWFVTTDAIALSLATSSLWQWLGVKTWTLFALQIVGGAALGWFFVPPLARWQVRVFVPPPAPAPRKPGKLIFIDRERLRGPAPSTDKNQEPRN